MFTLKGPRFATNRRVLAEAGDSIKRFFDSGVTELKEKLGPVNWQFMATKKFDAEDFEAFLKLLPKKVDGQAIRHAVEVRHDSFKCAEFVALCRKHGVAIVFGADSEFPLIADTTADFIYARLMGTQAKEKLGYPPAILKTWAERAQDWARGDPRRHPCWWRRPRRKRSAMSFMFVISGARKEPAAAQAIIAAL